MRPRALVPVHGTQGVDRSRLDRCFDRSTRAHADKFARCWGRSVEFQNRTIRTTTDEDALPANFPPAACGAQAAGCVRALARARGVPSGACFEARTSGLIVDEKRWSGCMGGGRRTRISADAQAPGTCAVCVFSPGRAAKRICCIGPAARPHKHQAPISGGSRAPERPPPLQARAGAAGPALRALVRARPLRAL
jgi:hypothetical protein